LGGSFLVTLLQLQAKELLAEGEITEANKTSQGNQL